jgi:hypothetical protein
MFQLSSSVNWMTKKLLFKWWTDKKIIATKQKQTFYN